MKEIIVLSLIAILGGCSASSKKENIVQEWRLPDKEDAIDDWARFNSPNKIIDDFNGDGKQDVAQILLKTNSNTGYIFKVYLSNSNSYILEKNEKITPQSVSIELLKPSNEILESACAKGYWDCAENEIRQFKVLKPSIQFCYIESACTVFMWSDRNGDFIKIPLSD